ncbi:hypothetical protein [Oceanispirochaeta sp.]|uniref:hypothetical protein n=1 Tax=Oceanispirochaeta sp. TaxID=2035350 RepID=UPI00261E153F|nr:hypothetical protein [Oceanispirochaeta sp.]MDA3955114.1 hypothetical protein [Oceanispirochaeta sp.]
MRQAFNLPFPIGFTGNDKIKRINGKINNQTVLLKVAFEIRLYHGWFKVKKRNQSHADSSMIFRERIKETTPPYPI